eukprot:11331995-Ditylum_brightwellii.AAC.1
MNYPAEAIGMISESQHFLLLSIINVWAQDMPIARRNPLSQQHLVGLQCVDATSKKLLIMYLPQVEVTINGGGDTNKEWITSTMLDAAVKLHLVKVLANQLSYNFNELARPFDDFPAHLMGDIIESILELDIVNPPPGNNHPCFVHVWLDCRCSQHASAGADGGILSSDGLMGQHNAVPVLIKIWFV